MNSLRNIFGGVALGLAVLTAPAWTAANSAVVTMAAAGNDVVVASSAVTKEAVQTSMTVIDLSADPYNLSPALDHIVTRIKEVRASDHKVIVLLGELHDTVDHVYAPEALRQKMERAGVEPPAIALEQRYNLLQATRAHFFPGNSEEREDFRARAVQALYALRSANPAHYNRVQAMAQAALASPYAPATRLSNFTTWLEDNADVRFVDLARNGKEYLDVVNPGTAAFIDEHGRKEDIPDRTKIHAGSPEGMRLRNLFMAQQLRAILQEAPVVILQPGLSHVGGNQVKNISYAGSLHALLTKEFEDDRVHVLTIIMETNGVTFENTVPGKGHTAMNNRDTIILRGSSGEQHDQMRFGSFEEEVAAIASFARASGNRQPPVVQNETDYRDRLKKNEITVIKEATDIVGIYAPHSSSPAHMPAF